MRSGLLIAHPDDEAWAFTAPLLAFDAPIAVYCATKGDAGSDLSGSELRGSSLGEARWGELMRSLDAIVGEGNYTVDGGEFGDGRTVDSPDELRKRVDAWADRHALDRIVTWGPAGGYGHVDHIACFESAMDVARARGVECWGAVLPSIPAQALYRALRRRFRLPIVAEDFDERLHRERIDVALPVDRDAKARAIRAHRTQLGDRPADSFVYPALTRVLLDEERFMVFNPTP